MCIRDRYQRRVHGDNKKEEIFQHLDQTRVNFLHCEMSSTQQIDAPVVAETPAQPEQSTLEQWRQSYKTTVSDIKKTSCEYWKQAKQSEFYVLMHGGLPDALHDFKKQYIFPYDVSYRLLAHGLLTGVYTSFWLMTSRRLRYAARAGFLFYAGSAIILVPELYTRGFAQEMISFSRQHTYTRRMYIFMQPSAIISSMKIQVIRIIICFWISHLVVCDHSVNYLSLIHI
eukprot:TRINITY_DN3078_c0_g1_i3.p1 TRINITY_DN3078_c0_g1~~TRINITY_DN3078_c0_g1_i3.p1  ORF type:complete len:228 (-),score=36.48 TRINITY_DN3078_c0_g1_i3:61-744(-)